MNYMSKPSKYSTQMLIDIIISYNENAIRKNRKISFSDLAKYAQEELGYEGIRYYHFSRNEKVKQMIEEYNTNVFKETINFVGEDNLFFTLNIEEMIKIWTENPSKIRLYMSYIREMIEKLRDFYITEKEENKELIAKLDEVKSENIELKERLKKAIKYKEENKMLKILLNEEYEKQKISALKSTKIHPIEILDKKNQRDENIYKSQEDNGKNLKETKKKVNMDIIFQGLNLDE